MNGLPGLDRVPVCCAILLASVACEPPAEAAGPVRVTYWSASNPHENALAGEIVGDFNRSHAGILVEHQPIPAGRTSEEIILSSIVSGTTPDLCSNIFPGIMGRLVDAKGVIALDAIPAVMERAVARTSPDQIDAFRHLDGRLYQLPWKVNPVMLGYDKELFEQEGLEPPRTWTEFLAVSRALTRDLDGDGDVDRWGLYVDIKNDWYKRFFDVYTLYLAASGGTTLVRGSAVIVDRKALAGVFDLMQGLFRSGSIPRATWAGAPLGDGRVGMRLISPYSMVTIRKHAREGFRIGIVPVPVPDDHRGPVFTFGDPKNIGIFSTCRDPDSAGRFLQALVSDAADLKLIEACGQLPNRPDLESNPVLREALARDPVLLAFAAAAGTTRGVDSTPHLVRIFDELSQNFEACCMFGLTDGETAAASFRRRVEDIFAFW